MVSRGLSGLCCLGLLAACNSEHAAPKGLVLGGFQLVDVEQGTLRSADVVLEGGTVSALSPAAASAQGFPRVEGSGRWLMPAFWDLKASLWGSESAKNWEELAHELGITDSLRVQLYYGVAHVLAAGMEREWMERELKRAAALELAAAEIVYPDLALCGEGGLPFLCVAPKAEAVPALLDERRQKAVDTLQIYFVDPGAKAAPGVPLPVLEAALAGAEQRGMRSYVFVDTWERAEQAALRGARALHGLPRGELSEALVATLASRGVAYAPALAGSLELTRVLGNREALADPFLVSSVPRAVLASFEDPAGLWEGWRPLLEDGSKRDTGLRDVERLARGGVRLLSATDVGWTSGTFQGYSTHAAQVWLERAGLGAWARLRALTLWPAEYMGRRAGFNAGDPADFVALAADPLSSAAALREIAFLVREGQFVERASLEPDVSRSRFTP